MSVVTLAGGHFDGQQVDVDPLRRVLTLHWEDEYLERDGEDGCVLYVTKLGQATYRRVGADRFEYEPGFGLRAARDF